MSTTLENKQINQTYQGLLKTSDNAEITTEVDITDGKGTSTGVRINNNGTLKTTSSIESPTITGTSGVVLSSDNVGGALETGIRQEDSSGNFFNFKSQLYRKLRFSVKKSPAGRCTHGHMILSIFIQ